MEWTRGVRRYWPWALLPLLGSLLLVVYRYLDGVARGGGEPLLGVVIKEMGGGLGTVLFLTPVVLLIRRFPFGTGRTLKHLPVHALGALVYSVLHTLWNWGFRTVMYGVVGMGAYDYGHMPTRFVMELPLDLITYSIVVVVVMVIERSRSARDREVQLARLQEQLQRTRLAQLQGQLRPHFLFNALNTVSSVMYQDVSKADRVLQALADILRKMVDQSEAVVVPLREELDLVAAMVEILEARFGDRLAVRQHVQEGVGDWPVPPLLLQPIVENAIQHAMPEGDGRLEVLVSATSSGGRLRLEVSDNGPGIGNGGRPEQGGGVGLRNTRERLATHFGDEGLFELSSGVQGGLHVVMEVPWTESAR